MDSERLIIEVVCATIIVLMSVALCLVSNFSPILASLKNASSLVQSLAFTCVPLSVYAVSRLVFTFWIAGTNSVLDGEGLKKLPGVVQPWASWLRAGSAMLIMYLGVAAARLVFPGLGQVASDLYSNYLGDLPEAIWNQTKGEREKAIGRGERVLYLLVAWFAFFFIVELLLRVVLMGIKMTLKLVFKSSKGATDKKETTPPPPDADEGEEK